MELADLIGRLGEDGRQLYSRWSPTAWRLCCQGPATQLWDALASSPDAQPALANYLYLLREAVGLQYLWPNAPGDLDPHDAAKAGASFLATAFCETLPRLLPKTPPADRARLMAQLFNVGEKLQSKPAWLNRYLAVRLLELDFPDALEPFLARVLEEGLEAVPDSPWKAPFVWQVIDPSPFDRDFLPGELHLATPSIVCVHDRRRAGHHVAVLLRKAGASICLGATPCLGKTGEPFTPGQQAFALFSEASLPERLSHLATRGGFAVLTSPLSQRLWIAEAKGK